MNNPADGKSLDRIPPVRFENFSIAQDTVSAGFIHYAAPFTAVYDIKADGDLIWFAQFKSVMSFDVAKKHWTIYTKSDGLEYNELYRIAITPDAVYAFAPYNGKMANRFDKKTQKWQAVPYETLPLGADAVSNSSCSPEIKLKGRELVNRANWDAAVLETDADIWFGGDGICRYGKARQTWNCWKRWDEGQAGVTSMGGVGSGKVWFGTKSGLIELDRKRGSWRRLTTEEGLQNNEILAIASDARRAILVHPGAVSVRDLKSGRWHVRRGMSNSSQALLIEDVLWLGGSTGLYAYAMSDWGAIQIPERIAKSTITALVSAGRRVWVGTSNGLHSFQSDDRTWSAWEWREGNFQVEGKNSSVELTPRRPGYAAPRLAVLALSASGEQVLVAFTLNEQERFIDARPKFSVVRFDAVAVKSSLLTQDKSLSSIAVRNMAEDDRGVWISDSRSLYRVENSTGAIVKVDQTFDIFPNPFLVPNEGLVPGPIGALGVIEGRLWVSTARGFAGFEKSSGWRSFCPSAEGVWGPLNIISNGRKAWVQTGYMHAPIAHAWAAIDLSKGGWEGSPFWASWRPYRASLYVKGQDLSYLDSSGVTRLNIESGHAIYLPSKEPLNGLLVAEDVWVTTKGELRRWDAKQKEWRGYPFDPGRLSREFSPYNSSSISLIQAGIHIWIGGRHGVAKFDTKSESFEYLNDLVDGEPIVGIAPGSSETWLVGVNGRVFRTSEHDTQFMRLPAMSVPYVIDEGRFIICAVSNEGIVLLDKERRTSRHLKKWKWASLKGMGPLAVIGEELWAEESEGIIRIPLREIVDSVAETAIDWQSVGRRKVAANSAASKPSKIISLNFSEPMSEAQVVIGGKAVDGVKRKTDKYPGETWEFSLNPSLEAILERERKMTVKATDLAGNPLIDKMPAGRNASGMWEVSETGSVEKRLDSDE